MRGRVRISHIFSRTGRRTHSHSRRCRSPKTRGFSCAIRLWLRNLEPVQRRRTILRHHCQFSLVLLRLFPPSCPRPLASGARRTISLGSSDAGPQLRLENVGSSRVCRRGNASALSHDPLQRLWLRLRARSIRRAGVRKRARNPSSRRLRCQPACREEPRVVPVPGSPTDAETHTHSIFS